MCASTCEKSGLMKLLWLRLFMQKEQQWGQCRPLLKLRFPLAFNCVHRGRRQEQRGGEEGGVESLILSQNTTCSRLSVVTHIHTTIRISMAVVGPFISVSPHCVVPMCVSRKLWGLQRRGPFPLKAQANTVSSNWLQTPIAPSPLFLWRISHLIKLRQRFLLTNNNYY